MNDLNMPTLNAVNLSKDSMSSLNPERIAKLETQVEGIKDDVADVKADIKDLHSRITTGNREIVDKISNLQHTLDDKLEASAKDATAQRNAIKLEAKVDIESIKRRVDILENWRWMIVGGAIAVGYVMGHLDFFLPLATK